MNELHSWREEKSSSYLYRVVAQCEKGTPREALFNELAERAEQQAGLWESKAQSNHIQLPQTFSPPLRTRLVAALVKRLGVKRMKPILTAMKIRGMSLYVKSPQGHAMPTNLDQVGKRHRNGGGGNLRAAVFGVNDGLVSNASLIMGVAGAAADSKMILLTGVAGLIAGALSMASGEYVSVRSQREMYEYQIGLESDELDEYPQEEAAELALIYEARGMSSIEAKKLADSLIADPKKALDALTREELGLNPDELGSPWGAAISSFLAFVTGAIVPLLPFLFAELAGISNNAALMISVAISALGLFGVGATLSLFTGKNFFPGGLRMLLIGGGAGLVAFSIGKMLGVSLG
ncbi:MAG: VIT1/CCC1 transporter family protein [Burkholderiales bacterium]